MTWQDFVIHHGWRARGDHLAHVLGQPQEAIDRLRGTGACVRLKNPLRFGELFLRWHGREPIESDWPAPRKIGAGYEWLPPEKAIVAATLGMVGPLELCRTLTERLRRVTGDPTAERSRNMLQVVMQRIGLEVRDVLGGVTVSQAAREIGTRSILDHEIRKGRIRTMRIGRYVVIPHEEFRRWKASRTHPPKGFIRLREVQKKLGIKSDKLSEFARDGHVPTAVCCNTYAAGGASTRWGTWWIDPKAARKLIADRRAGRPMPWHGKPEMGNLRTTFKLWQERQHPPRCLTCQDIWGPEGAPRTFDDYVKRYPPIALGAKRHLTRPYSDGLTREQVAEKAGLSVRMVQVAIANGVLRARRVGRADYITATDAARWIARRCANGASPKSWLTIETACKAYLFTEEELEAHIASGRLRLRQGAANGTWTRKRYLLKQQVRELRDELGYTEAQAATRVGVSIARMRTLLRGVNWRQAERIPLVTVQACLKRKRSAHGYTIAEAARMLKKSRAWIQNEINAGTVRPLRTKWNIHRLYITEPMFTRLQAVARHPRPRPRWTVEWLYVNEAATLAGVSINTVQLWASAGDVKARKSPNGMRYHRRSLKARARRYWAHEVRFKRAQPPAWISAAA